MIKRIASLFAWFFVAGLASAPSALAWGEVHDTLFLDPGRPIFFEQSRSVEPSRAVSVVGNPLVNFGPKSYKFRYDPRMVRAAEIAALRAHAHSTRECWSYVKTALVDAQVVATRPGTEFAKEAGFELQERYGFKEINIQNPFDAPVGAILVYGGNGAGHVEIRTDTGFASDFFSFIPSPRPLIGVYVKPS